MADSKTPEDLLRDQLRAADARIAELESRIRQGETTERERVRLMRELHTKQLATANDQIEKLEAELRTSRATVQHAAEAAETTCARLIAWTPVIKYARAIVTAWTEKDDKAGDRAARAMHDAVLQLPAEPS